MLKKCVVFGVVFLAASAISAAAYAQDIKGRAALGYRYGYVVPDDDDFKTHGNSHNLNVSYGLTNNLALECEGGYFKLKSKAGSEIGVYSAHAALQARINLKNFAPYVIGGAGWQFYDYDSVKGGDRKDNGSSFSYKSGAGLEYFLNKNWAFNFEAVYIYGNTGGDATLDVYSWQYGLGTKYYF